MFYRGFFFLLFLALWSPSSLNGTQRKSGHMVGSKCDLKRMSKIWFLNVCCIMNTIQASIIRRTCLSLLCSCLLWSTENEVGQHFFPLKYLWSNTLCWLNGKAERRVFMIWQSVKHARVNSDRNDAHTWAKLVSFQITYTCKTFFIRIYDTIHKLARIVQSQCIISYVNL